jgi:flavin-dependent dehydrogenase
MIDPFTGTGIQIALRTGEIAAEAIFASLSAASSNSISQNSAGILQDVLARYSSAYEKEFGKRMKVAGLLRAAAFSPATANFLASVLAIAPGLARRLLRATRSGARMGGEVRRV